MHPGVLYLDIETTGLDAAQDKVTVVCVRDEQGRREAFEAGRERAERGTDDTVRTRVEAALDACAWIAAYNGRKFDVPFLAAWAQRDPAPWLAKTVDLCALVFEATGRYVGLSELCAENGVAAAKTATGRQAVAWARQGRWDALREYCAQDVEVLAEVSARAHADGLRAHACAERNVVHRGGALVRLDRDTGFTLTSTRSGPSYTPLAESAAVFRAILAPRA